MLKCPVCGAVYRPSISIDRQEGQEGQGELSCRRCKVNLSELIRIHDLSIWYHRQALDLCRKRDYLTAQANNNRAIALYSRYAEFHTLAGKLSALQGNFRQAIAAWRIALEIDPQNEIATCCLQMVSQFKIIDT